jgi:PAS domain-containing protein
VNREFTALTGYSLQHLGSVREWCRCFRPADEENSLCEQFWEGYLSDPAPYPVVLSIRCRNGEIRDIEFRASLSSADALRVIMLEDVTERKRNERHIAKALKYQQEHHGHPRLRPGNAPYGIVVTDGREIILSEPEFTLMKGYTRQDLPIGKRLVRHTALRHGRGGGSSFGLLGGHKRRTGERLIAPIRCKSGERKIAEFRRSRSLENGSFVIIVSDITERQRFAEELEKALQREKELNELKNTFISMVSHEFRTPMSTILSAATILDRHGESLKKPQIERYVESIHQGIFDEHLWKHLEAGGSNGESYCRPGLWSFGAPAAVVADVEPCSAERAHRDDQRRGSSAPLRRRRWTCFAHSDEPALQRRQVFPENDRRSSADPRAGRGASPGRQGFGIGFRRRIRRLFYVFNGRNVGTVRGTGVGLASETLCHATENHFIDSVVNEGTVVTVLLPAGGGSQRGEGTP